MASMAAPMMKEEWSMASEYTKLRAYRQCLPPLDSSGKTLYRDEGGAS